MTGPCGGSPGRVPTRSVVLERTYVMQTPLVFVTTHSINDVKLAEDRRQQHETFVDLVQAHAPRLSRCLTD